MAAASELLLVSLEPDPLSEVDVLTALTTAAYDDGDWGDADPDTSWRARISDFRSQSLTNFAIVAHATNLIFASRLL